MVLLKEGGADIPGGEESELRRRRRCRILDWKMVCEFWNGERESLSGLMGHLLVLSEGYVDTKEHVC